MTVFFLLCAAVLCSEPPIIEHASVVDVVDPHGNIESMNMQGARAYYPCDRNYRLADENANILKCDRTQWMGKRPQCTRKGCNEPLTIEHG